MTTDELNQLRGLMRAATPGPLTVMARNHGEQCVAVVNNLELVPPNSVELAHEKADADFIAAAVNALPALLDEVERLRAMLSAAGCMMPTASGFIQLDTNDRAALNAAIDAAMKQESGEQSTSSFENFMEIPDGGR